MKLLRWINNYGLLSLAIAGADSRSDQYGNTGKVDNNCVLSQLDNCWG